MARAGLLRRGGAGARARALGALGLAIAGCGRVAYVSRGDAAGESSVDAREGGPVTLEAGFDAGDAPPEVSTLEAATDASDAMDAMGTTDAMDVLDATDAPVTMDATDSMPATDTMDAMGTTDATDAATDAAIACEAGSRFPSANVVLPTARTLRAGDLLTVSLRFGEPARVAAGRAADVRATLLLQNGSVPLALSSAGGLAPDEVRFEYRIAPGDYDSDSLVVLFDIADGALEDGAGCPRVFTLGPGARASRPGLVVHAGFECPQNFVYVPPAAEYALPQGFCVSAYEMTQGATPTAAPSVSLGNAPTGGVSRANAVAACGALGPGYHLVTNAEWQTIARNVERTHDNWSGLEPASGRLNIGSIGPEQGGVATSMNPCETVGFPVRFPNCTDRSDASGWEHKRTHVLSNGAIVWDLGGNHSEWVPDVPPSTPRSYACELAGEDKRLYGPALTYSPCTVGTDPTGDEFGLGYAEGTGGNALIRGSGGNIEGGVFFAIRGIFYSNTNSFWSGGPGLEGGPGFRCAYMPTTAPVAEPVMDPVNVTVRPGASVFLHVAGNAPTGLVWGFEEPSSPPALTPEGDGVRFTAGAVGARYVVRARAGDGRVFLGAVTVGTPGV